MQLEAADKTIICSAGQLSPVGRCWSLVRNSLMGFNIMNLVGLHWVPNDMHMDLKWSWETSLWLSLWVYNVDIKPVLIYKGANSTGFSVSCILGMSVLSFILLFCPYVSMEIGAQKSQLPPRWTMSSLLTVIIGRYKHQHLTCCHPKRIRIHLRWSPLLICSEDPPMRESHLELFGVGNDIAT